MVRPPPNGLGIKTNNPTPLDKSLYIIYLLLRPIMLIFYTLIAINCHFLQSLIYRKDNFVYHHWECTSIYHPSSYALDR